MRININIDPDIGSDVCGFYEIQLEIVLTTSEGKVVLKDVMLIPHARNMSIGNDRFFPIQILIF